MARRSATRVLSIWSNGERVGTWRLPVNGPMELRYDAAWMASPQGRPLSLSLPFRADDDAPHVGEKVAHYFGEPAARQRRHPAGVWPAGSGRRPPGAFGSAAGDRARLCRGGAAPA